MYHYVYKTTNTITGKYYIGAHSTHNLNDGYLGSGKAIKDSITKYGKENFRFEILQFFNTRNEAFHRESEIVTEELVASNTTYNMCTGGLGCATKSDDWKKRVSEKLKGRIFSKEHSKKKSLAQTGERNHRFGKPNANTPRLLGSYNGMYGRTHTDESKMLMSENRKKAKVTYTPELLESLSSATKGKLWFNNGIVSKRFNDGNQPEGFFRGRLPRKEMGLE